MEELALHPEACAQVQALTLGQAGRLDCSSSKPHIWPEFHPCLSMSLIERRTPLSSQPCKAYSGIDWYGALRNLVEMDAHTPGFSSRVKIQEKP